jgi:hypothetical protein
MSQINVSTIDGVAQIIAPRAYAAWFPRPPLRKADTDQTSQSRDELSFLSWIGRCHAYSDVVLQSSQEALRLAARCTDERVAANSHVLANKLLSAVGEDAELMVEEIPISPGVGSRGK